MLCPEATRDPSRARKRPVPAAQEAAAPSSSGKAAGAPRGMTMEAKLNSVLAGESTGCFWCQLCVWVLAGAQFG